MIDQTTGVLDRLRVLDAAIAQHSNRHDRAIILIKGCLAEGINRGPEIIQTLTDLSFDRRHAGKMLSDECGPNPERHHWEKLTDGSYRSHGGS
ncbi:hypothetical protein [Croceicoccus marinus]|uniref:Uncharacterized protein n=1 Tax=Croceicoccus marinus TaxID=450378 RepID=A0A1Z1FCT6_9SPHN|nr:hypothetical protein [Croceicoccus marinus]ARU16570.1 hypothetical protein A9D14_10735 [Croceicoccus marinus]